MNQSIPFVDETHSDVAIQAIIFIIILTIANNKTKQVNKKFQEIFREDSEKGNKIENHFMEWNVQTLESCAYSIVRLLIY